MQHAPRTRRPFPFRRDRLPPPAEYFDSQGLKLIGGGEWKSALCPFHNDTKPSLRVRIETGGFRCMVCGAHGGDVLAFHMQRYCLTFFEAAIQLGAWGDGQ
jgi:DNA primase